MRTRRLTAVRVQLRHNAVVIQAGTFDVAERLRHLLRERAHRAWREQAIPDTLPLGADGLGLDSVAIVETLMECEVAFGVPFPASLFDEGALTVGRLVEHAMRCRTAAQS
jgi:acyl carrier protein